MNNNAPMSPEKMYFFSFIIIICIIGYVFYNNSVKEQNMTSLEKYYQTHPEQYKKDMNNQQFIENAKKEMQAQEDKENLNN